MKVFKFGGASVKDAAGVRNIAEVIRLFGGEDILVVVSAMGKTTNALEMVARSYYYGDNDPALHLDGIRIYHDEILKELFPVGHSIYEEVGNCFVEIEWAIEDKPTGTYDYEYDQIVSMGELISSKIVAAWLKECGLPCRWRDARDVVRTDNTYREARVDWELSGKIAQNLKTIWFDGEPVINLTQGFIGCTSENYTTTLGREGSDFTAAIMAYLFGGESVTIWKDVPGVLNADPKWFDNTVKLRHISYLEAVELAYYGATVIHPKTIKPLQNKGIPLFVKSFIDPKTEGTMIDNNISSDSLIPSFIFRMNQVLISISPKDYSFIVEDNLSGIFATFSTHRVKINLMQNSAISFSVCVDDDSLKLPQMLATLREQYTVRYNEQLELVTIRHYNQETIDRVTMGKEVLVEQKSRSTARMVMRDLSRS